MTHTNLTEDDLREFAALLPESMLGMASVAGFAAVHALVSRCGGTILRIGKNDSAIGRLLHQELAAIVGETAADRIETAYGGNCRMQIPRCKKAMNAVRNNAIRRDFDRHTSQMSGVKAVNKIALEYGIGSRAVWQILKCNDDVPRTNPDCIGLKKPLRNF